MSKGFRDADDAQVMSERETNDQIQRVLEQDRQQAEHARELRANGAYGICEGCGQAIDPERLAVLTDATRCVGCQAAWDRENR